MIEVDTTMTEEVFLQMTGTSEQLAYFEANAADKPVLLALYALALAEVHRYLIKSSRFRNVLLIITGVGSDTLYPILIVVALNTTPPLSFAGDISLTEVFLFLASCFAESRVMQNGMYTWVRSVEFCTMLRRWFERGFSLLDTLSDTMHGIYKLNTLYQRRLYDIFRTTALENSGANIMTILRDMQLSPNTLEALQTQYLISLSTHGGDARAAFNDALGPGVFSHIIPKQKLLAYAERVYYNAPPAKSDCEDTPVTALRRILRERFPVGLLTRQSPRTKILFTDLEARDQVSDLANSFHGWYTACVLAMPGRGIDGVFGEDVLGSDVTLIRMYDDLTESTGVLADDVGVWNRMSHSQTVSVVRFFLLKRWAVRFKNLPSGELDEYNPPRWFDFYTMPELSKVSDDTLRDYVRLAGVDAHLMELGEVRHVMLHYSEWLVGRLATTVHVIYAVVCLLGFEMVRHEHLAHMLAMIRTVREGSTHVSAEAGPKLSRFISILGRVPLTLRYYLCKDFMELRRPRLGAEDFCYRDFQTFGAGKESHWSVQRRCAPHGSEPT